MNFKKTALAFAMAGIIAAPMAVQADVGAYASIRLGVVSSDDGTKDLDIRSNGSRFGFKNETDLGNGMTAFGLFEFGVNTDSGDAEEAITELADPLANPPVERTTKKVDHILTRRHALVGLKGDFGSVTLGQTNHTYYKHIHSAVDIANWHSGFYSISRTSNGLTYAGEAGPVSFGATLYAADGNTGDTGDKGLDSSELAASFDAGPVRIGVGVKNFEVDTGSDPETQAGVSVRGTFGDVYVGVSLQSNHNGVEDDDTVELSVSAGPVYLIYGQKDDTETIAAVGTTPEKINKIDPTELTLGYSLAIGPQTSAWFEYKTKDPDTTGGEKSSSLEAVLNLTWN